MNRILFLLLALGLLLVPVRCCAAEPNVDQAKAAAEIEKRGGKVTVDEKSPGKPVIAAALSRDSDKNAEVGRFQGQWAIKSATIQGHSAEDDLLRDSWFLFLGSKLKFLNYGGFRIAAPLGDWDIDPGTSPGTFDWYETGTDRKKIVIRGIYELEDDKLRIGYLNNEARPKEFSKDINLLVLIKKEGVTREDLEKEMKKEIRPAVIGEDPKH
jgi:uncharacterized protein (TIGR03067 family)